MVKQSNTSRASTAERVTAGLLTCASSYPIADAIFALPGSGGSISVLAVSCIVLVLARWHELNLGTLRLPLAFITVWLAASLLHASLWVSDDLAARLAYPAVSAIALLAGAALSRAEMRLFIQGLGLALFLAVTFVLGQDFGFDYIHKAKFNEFGLSLNGLANLAALPVTVMICSVSSRGMGFAVRRTAIGGAAGTITVIASGSASVIPGLVIGILAATAFGARSKFVRTGSWLIGLGVITIYMRYLFAAAVNSSDDLRGRGEMWIGAAELARAHFPGGLGIEQSYIQGWMYAPHPVGTTVLAGGVHSWPLQMVLALGAIGIFLLFAAVIVGVCIFVRATRSRYWLSVGCLAWAVFTLGARSLVESDGNLVFFRPSIQSLLAWMVMGWALHLGGTEKLDKIGANRTHAQEETIPG